jgi:hypothetical protein
MQMMWLGIAIAATVGYHVVLKLTPAGVNPYLSLAVTYAVTTLVFTTGDRSICLRFRTSQTNKSVPFY